MKLHKYFLLLFFSVFTTSATAQSADSTGHLFRQTGIMASYNSSLIYPGARLGLELPIITVTIKKTKKNGKEKIFVRDRYATINLSWYHHPLYHDNIYLIAGWTMRRTGSKGFFMEFTPEAGISRTFINSITYRVDNNGNVTVEKLPGYFYALLSAGGGLGYDLISTQKVSLSVFAKFNLLMMFPYNSTVYLRPAVELGLVYTPSHFLNLKVIVKRKTK